MGRSEPPREHAQSRRADSTRGDRLTADAVLVQHFRERGHTGPVWREFLNHVLGYGLGIVTSLIQSGAMFERCRGRGLDLNQQSIPAAEIEDLASESVTAGFELFCTVGLVGGGWSAERGQTLEEYFVNSCVLSFPNVYRKWQRGRRHWKDVHLLDTWEQLNRVRAGKTPEDDLVARVAVDEVFQQLKEDSRLAIFLADQGFTHAEIAQIMRLTPGAVEGRIYRARRAARKALEGQR